MSQNVAVRIFRGILRWIDRFRRLLHLVFMLFVLALVVAVVTPQQPIVPGAAALVLEPQGVIVDELSGDPLERALAVAQGLNFGETLLADLVEAVRQASGDNRIRALVLRLDGLTGAGLSKLQELADEIDRFRETGKPVYAVGAGFDDNQYLLAAHADEVLMHPMGLVLIDGFMSYTPYFKSALEKIYVDYNAWTVGSYKSFVEPFTRDDMSPEDRESRSEYLDALWSYYQRDVEEARGLEPESLQRYADEFVSLLRAADGSSSALAVDYGLIDGALPYDEVNALIREAVGGNGSGSDDVGYAAIGYRDYLTALRAVRLPALGTRKVGVIVASGTILDGLQPQGTVGGDSLIRLIQRARDDEGIRALVLRVDSPGGSAFASERIRRELEVFRESGRPVVVSMGSVAASGGYWIAMNADEIWASPTTLTGSIGVGATFPTFDRALSQLGINIDGLGTTELAGQLDPLQGVGPEMSEYIQLSIEDVYEEFVTKVAQYREQDLESVEAAAQGRIWIGSRAQELGLVDRLGNLDDAVRSAAELAGLTEGAYTVERLQRDLGWAEQIALELVRIADPAISALGVELRLPAALRRLIEAASEPLAFVEQLNDPRGVYVYCFCDVE